MEFTGLEKEQLVTTALKRTMLFQFMIIVVFKSMLKHGFCINFNAITNQVTGTAGCVGICNLGPPYRVISTTLPLFAQLFILQYCLFELFILCSVGISRTRQAGPTAISDLTASSSHVPTSGELELERTVNAEVASEIQVTCQSALWPAKGQQYRPGKLTS